jgi:hypothetical protein
LLYCGRFDAVGGAIRKPKGQKPENRRTNKWVGLRVSKGLSIAGVFAAALFAAAPAHASVESQLKDLGKGVGDISRDVVSFFGFGPNQADNPTDPQSVRPELKVRAIEPVEAVTEAAMPVMPAAAREKPTVERPLHRLFCVEYARMRSGMAVFGDARQWWDRAKHLYTRLSTPAEEAVMVFAGSHRLRRGHVAVVTEIVSPREIIVDQANWQNHGEIDHATPVLDVSKANDWSLVRVWDIPSGAFGARTYPISGFIAKGLTRQAMND